MDIVDAQLHLNLLGIDAALAAMDAIGVSAVLIDEFWGYDENRSQIPYHRLRNGSTRPVAPTSELAVALHPERFAYVARYGPDDPDLPQLIQDLRLHPGRLALRITPYQMHPGSASFEANAHLAQHDYDAISAGAYDHYFSLAERHEVAVFLQIAGVEVPPQLEMAERILQTFPDLQLIIDHCGVTLPVDPAAATAQTRGQVTDVAAALAKFPNAALKWGHAPELSAFSYPYPDAIEMLHELLEAFGAERVMWASDWMPGVTPYSWAESLYYVRDSDQLTESEKQAVLGGSVRRILRWPRA